METPPKILAIIPARGGSKSIPGKNMKTLGGVPLVDYTIRSAQQSEMLTKIIVSTDCPKTADHASNFEGVAVPFLRPSELSDDFATTYDVVVHALNFLEGEGETFTSVMLLQPACPFRNAVLIDDCARRFLASEADSLVTVRKIPHHYSPFWAFQKACDGLITPVIDKPGIARRQDLPDTYCRDGQIYVSRVSVIKKGSLLGDRIEFFERDHFFNINLDTPAEWDLAEKMLSLWAKDRKKALLSS